MASSMKQRFSSGYVVESVDGGTGFQHWNSTRDTTQAVSSSPFRHFSYSRTHTHTYVVPARWTAHQKHHFAEGTDPLPPKKRVFVRVELSVGTIAGWEFDDAADLSTYLR